MEITEIKDEMPNVQIIKGVSEDERKAKLREKALLKKINKKLKKLEIEKVDFIEYIEKTNDFNHKIFLNTKNINETMEDLKRIKTKYNNMEESNVGWHLAYIFTTIALFALYILR